MADSKLAALEATAAAPFTSTLERVRPHTKLIGLLPLGRSYAQPATILRAVLLITALLPLAGFVTASFLPAPAER